MARKGFLLVLMQPPPTLEEEFNAWYDTEHIPERLAVPGFETALRFVCIDGAPRYLAMYDLAHADVLESEAYRQVSGAGFSPWTKRVTGRVRIYRSAGAQIWPGDRLTGRAARMLLVRFRDLAEADGTAVVAGLRQQFEGLKETIQMRVFAYPTGSGVDYLGLVETRAPLTGTLDPAPFGRLADAIDLANSYVAY